MHVPLLLALLSLPWAWPGRAGQCHSGELRELSGGDTKCCPPCAWNGDDPKPCRNVSDKDCRCPQGSSCGDKECEVCLRVPQCEPGWEPHSTGVSDFHFECRRCRNGSYSGSRNSWCRSWTDCESNGFITLRAGNSTHNSVCSLPVRALEPGLPLEWGSSTVLALLTAVAVFVLILLTVLLLVCLWSLRRDTKVPPGDFGAHFPPRLIQGEESRSIQFPEEEHGDKTEEKLSVLSLKVYSELR